ASPFRLHVWTAQAFWDLDPCKADPKAIRRPMLQARLLGCFTPITYPVTTYKEPRPLELFYKFNRERGNVRSVRGSPPLLPADVARSLLSVRPLTPTDKPPEPPRKPTTRR